MKRAIQILFFAILIAIGTGYYFKNSGDDLTGDRIIGIAVLASAFLLMPLFIYHRSRGKNIQNYMLTKENFEKMNGKKGNNPDNQ